MIEQIITWDQQLLIAINNWNSPFMDQVMWYISTKWLWIPLYLLLAALLCHRFGWKRGLLYVVGIVLAVGLSDWITSGVLKPWVARLRPTRDPVVAPFLHIVNGYRGGKYGFPSSHAANCMTIALLYTLLTARHPFKALPGLSSCSQPSERPFCAIGHKKKRSPHACVLLLLWTLMVSYSRMYLGVHFPLDILTGLLTGALVALLAAAFLTGGERTYHKHFSSDRSSGGGGDSNSQLVYS